MSLHGTGNTPVVHSVHFYDDDPALIQRLRGIVFSSLGSGNSVLIVATQAHRLQLKSALRRSGVDVRTAENEGLLSMYDAHDTLSQFLSDDGEPDIDRWRHTVRAMLSGARESADGNSRGLTVFGEMVALLWAEGRREAALQVEMLWNDLLGDGAFHLHCAYPRALVQDASGMLSICEQHNHVVGKQPTLQAV